jgi:uncharacterized membrane protein YdjX (TVP38/TMEM64 family)
MNKTGMNKTRALTISVALCALIGIGWWLVAGQDLMGLLQQLLQFLRTVGPLAFFLAMALLPAIGMPIAFFSLTAGSVFGPQLGMPTVLLLSLLAITVNITLSYWLANRALRPLLERVVKRLGYPLPTVDPRNATDLIVLLRVTPGLPFSVQNYLLGLAGVPIARYLLLSCLIALPLNAAVIVFGDGLLRGQGGMALMGLMLLLAAMAALHWVRRRYRRPFSGKPVTGSPGSTCEDSGRFNN